MPNKSQQLYFVAIIPPSPLREEIQELKKYVSSKYNSHHSLKAPPHITLLAPFNFTGKQKQLSAKLESYCSIFSPVEISLKNYSNFGSRVLFIDVIENQELNSLQKELETKARADQETFNYNYDVRDFNPHITMAFRDLSKSDFNRAWKEFKNKEFEAEFVAEQISLLMHDGEKWEVTGEFKLQG